MPSLSATDPIKKLLVRIKFLLEVSLPPHLARSSEADNILALILLDYCVESLLKTIMTAAAVNLTEKGKLTFNDLWKNINDKVLKDKQYGTQVDQLPFRIELENLHLQRNQTQHDSRTPSHSDVERDAVNVREFARQVYLGVYALDYQSLTLIDLVRNKLLKRLLSESEALLNAGEWEKSAIKSGETMARLLRMSSSYSPLGRTQNFYSIAHGISDGATHSAIEKLVKSIEGIEEGMTLQMQIVMGLDFKGYARYKHFAPIVHIMMDGSANASFVNHDLNPVEAKWLLDYVLGNVLRMEEAGLEWHELG